MNNPERLPSETRKPITGYLWGALAVLTCPCHLPILAIVLAGTTAGRGTTTHGGKRRSQQATPPPGQAQRPTPRPPSQEV